MKRPQIFILVLFLLAGSAWIVFKNTQFHVVRTNPSMRGVSVISPFIKVDFNKKLNPSSLDFSSSDGLIVAHSVNGKEVYFSLGSMQLNTKYSLSINSITSIDGKVLRNIRYTFSPSDVSYIKLPKDQQKAISNRQDVYQPTKSDPILAHLPYGTPDFQLVAKVIDDAKKVPSLVIEASLLPSAADARTNEAAALNQYKQEVIDYIKSIGLDPGNYNIQYQTVEPSLF